MAKSLLEYAQWLGERNLLWPAAPACEPAKANPTAVKLAGVKAVVWDIYGTLLCISDGDLLLQHPQAIRMQIAMEKTIEEFKMWNSMTRRPGKPYEYFLPKYHNAIEELKLQATEKRGDTPEVNLAQVWKKLVQLLQHKDYQYDTALYGDFDEFCEKIAFYFHMSLQGVGLVPGAREVIETLAENNVPQGLLANGQAFTWAELLRQLQGADKIASLVNVLRPETAIISANLGIRKPSPSLFDACRDCWLERGFEPEQVLYVGTRISEDLAVAKKFGFRTALFAGNQLSLRASHDECKDPATRPDRLITSLPQVLSSLG